jgi:hypothetical protein
LKYQKKKEDILSFVWKGERKEGKKKTHRQQITSPPTTHIVPKEKGRDCTSNNMSKRLV